jgi:protein-tyrosine-phosphatase
VHPELQRALDDADGLLFLCSGNMIRSAFAELYARHLGIALPVRSAGTTYSNTRIHVEAACALTARGVVGAEIREFRPQLIEALDPAPRQRELVIGMTRAHSHDSRHSGAPGPHFLMRDAVGEPGEIADPYFEGGYEQVFRDLARCVEALTQAVRGDG